MYERIGPSEPNIPIPGTNMTFNDIVPSIDRIKQYGGNKYYKKYLKYKNKYLQLKKDSIHDQN